MSDRVIIVSGGSRGLGLTLVRHFLAAGDSVATFSRKPSEAVESLGKEAGDNGRFMYQSADATDGEAVRAFVGEVHRRFGRIDALVNNAGIARDGVLATVSDADIDQVVAINLSATLRLTREVVRLMLLKAHGRIVNVSSIIGQRGYSGLSVYTATKAALIGVTASLARELGPKGITVNCVAPGYLETEMTGELDEQQKGQIVRRTPLGRLGTPGDVVGAVDFFLSESAGYVTGQTIAIDGGISC